MEREKGGSYTIGIANWKNFLLNTGTVSAATAIPSPEVHLALPNSLPLRRGLKLRISSLWLLEEINLIFGFSSLLSRNKNNNEIARMAKRDNSPLLKWRRCGSGGTANARFILWTRLLVLIIPLLLLIDWEVFSGGGVWSAERLIRSQKRVGAEFRAIVDLPIDPLCPKTSI